MAHLRSAGSVLSLLPFLVTLSMLTNRAGCYNAREKKTCFTCTTLRLPLLVTLSMFMDRAGCYNVREKKLIVRQLTSTVNSSGIATFSVRGEGQRF